MAQQRAIQAVAISSRQNDIPVYHFSRDAVQRLLCDPRIADKKIVVMSIVGSFRKGKSFFMNQAAKFLRCVQSGIPTDSAEWLKASNNADYFEWNSGWRGVTSGIWMCPEIFVVRQPNGEEVAVLLMDSQGIDDINATKDESVLAFGMPILTSSVTIYNVKGLIDLSSLEHVQHYVEYGTMVQRHSGGLKPFQSWTVLVRDWINVHEFQYGFEGGRRYLMKTLQASAGPNNNLLKEFVATTFREAKCFLMPDPRVNDAPQFNGDMNQATADFVQGLDLFIKALFSPAKLERKLFGGRSVTCAEWFQYFDSYMQVFLSNKLPSALSLVEVTAKIQNKKLKDDFLQMYKASMESALCGEEAPWMDLVSGHEREKATALGQFDATPKMGGAQLATPYRVELEAAINQLYVNFEAQCTQKRAAVTKEATSRMLCDYKNTMSQVVAESEEGRPVRRTAFRSKHDEAKAAALNAFKAQFEPYAGSRPSYSFDLDLQKLDTVIENEFPGFKRDNEKYRDAAERRMQMDNVMTTERERHQKEMQNLREMTEADRQHRAKIEKERRDADERRHKDLMDLQAERNRDLRQMALIKEENQRRHNEAVLDINRQMVEAQKEYNQAVWSMQQDDGWDCSIM